MRKPKISVVIPAYNEEMLLPKCLDSVLNQSLPRKLYEVIVVDNASTDRTAVIAREKGVRVVWEGKKGYVWALKKGVREAKGEIIAITDADCRVPKDWLEKIYNSYKKDPQLDAVGGPFKFFDGNFFFRFIVSFLVRYSIRDLTGANLSFKKSSFRKIGGFDPRVNLGADVLLSLKFRRFGKIKIDRSNIVATSSRRYQKGLFSNFLFYTFNYLSLVFFWKPLFFDFPDIRLIPKKVEKKKPSFFWRLFKPALAFVLAFFIFTTVLPTAVHSRKIIKNHLRTGQKIVALTFDDGPDPIITPKILEILKEKNIQATFFLIGRKVKDNPHLAYQIVEEGDVVGNHSFYHHLWSGTEEKNFFEKDFLLAQREIEKATGKKPVLLRPPHGIASLWFLKKAKDYGFKVVFWDVEAKDWQKKTTAQQIVKEVTRKTKPGAIILLHDGLDFKVGTQNKVVEALPQIIEELEKKGYSFVTVDKLLGATPYFD
jgi:peptidoglycan/xylan/chitin deacetylase (PgdA/CDA1 family)